MKKISMVIMLLLLVSGASATIRIGSASGSIIDGVTNFTTSNLFVTNLAVSGTVTGITEFNTSDLAFSNIVYESELNSISELNTQITDATFYDVCGGDQARVAAACVDILTESELNSISELNTQISETVLIGGTLTDTKYCVYDQANAEIDCNAEGGAAANSTEQMQDAVMSGIDDGTQTGITVTYQDATNDMDFIVNVIDTNTNCSGDLACTNVIYESEIDTFSELNTQISDATMLKGGTLTNGKMCSYDGSNINCNTDTSFGFTCVIAMDGTGTSTDFQGCLDNGGTIYVKTNITTNVTFNATVDNTQVKFNKNAWILHNGDYAGFQVKGTNGVTSDITTDIDLADLTVDVTNGALFSEGDYIKIRSNISYAGSTETYGELNRVFSVSGNEITLDWATNFEYDFDATHTGYVQVYDPVENVNIEDMKVKCVNDSITTNEGIIFDRTVNGRGSSLGVENCDERGIEIQDGLFTHIYDSYVKNTSFVSGMGYGLKFAWATAYSSFNNVNGYHCQQVFDCGGTAGGGIPNNNFVNGLTAIYFKGSDSAIHSHPACDTITFNNINIVGNDSTQGTGFRISGLKTKINDANVWGVNTCAWIGKTEPGNIDYTIIDNMNCRGAFNGVAISGGENFTKGFYLINSLIETSANAVDLDGELSNININNNYLKSNGVYSVAIDSPAETFDVIEKLSLRNNEIHANFADPVRVYNRNATFRHSQITGNTIYTLDDAIEIRSANSGEAKDIIISNNIFVCEDGACDDMIFLREDGGIINYSIVVHNIGYGGFTSDVTGDDASDIVESNMYR